jgi:pyridinium-3,5-biscarboxylic acid mononucleotide synthase
MDSDQFRLLFEQVRNGTVGVESALERVRHLPFEDLGFAKIDHHRVLRHGMPEVIFAKGKTPEQVASITERLLDNSPNVLITRADAECARVLTNKFPEAEHFPLSGVVRFWRNRATRGKGKIVVVSAGTSDIPVGEEAQITAETMGNEVDVIYDIGVAGIHRLMHSRERLTQDRVVVVCAGMEGALPSAVGGLVSCPVIAVPTSIGYGASFNGLAALLGMLNSCASNVTVVNIDNGFGAGYVSSLINQL